ncbi:DUF2938 domain-containing protein [Corynebacterium freiburgense]|uniref:DUF2938 domain-containing protein n=1 Tax=Corynebacterium freiburgense TaxID=556548 RepID=UPI00196A0AFA|nr:DUF2938 domain-containing protein [Corynebacterium freiburgense]
MIYRRDAALVRSRTFISDAIAIGVGATVVMDVTAELVKRKYGLQPLNLDLVGRWIGHMPRGVIKHPSIMQAEPIPNERLLGWAAHYGIGIGFAGMLIATKPQWVDNPTFSTAFTAGLMTTAAPWLLMQPAFGIGVAANKLPNPDSARIGSLRAHASYGVGLYAAAKLWKLLKR